MSTRILVFFGFLLAVALFLGGCASGGYQQAPPAQDLLVGWDITPLTGVNVVDAVQVCLEMSYAGEQRFSGEVALEDDVGEQLGGVERVVQAFSSELFIPRGNLMYYRVCPAGDEFITYKSIQGNALKKVGYAAYVKIAKSEQVYSSKFCVPGGLKEEWGCPSQTNVNFPGSSSLGAAQVKITKAGDTGKIIAILPLAEKCDLVKVNVLESGANLDKGKGLNAVDVQVSLKESGVRMKCGVENVDGTEKRKTLKCVGDIPLDAEREDNEAVVVQMQYGCVYKMQREVRFDETFKLDDAGEGELT